MSVVKSFDTIEEVETEIQDFEAKTKSKFIVYKSSRNFGYSVPGGKAIFFEDRKNVKTCRLDFTGIPFSIGGKKVLDCQFGINRKKARQKNLKGQEHSYDQGKRFMVLGTKKKECRASIFIREILHYHTYTVEKNELLRKSRNIIKTIKEDTSVQFKRMFYVCFSNAEVHNGHPLIQEYPKSMDHRILAFIKKKTEGVVSVGQMKMHINDYIKGTFDRLPHPSVGQENPFLLGYESPRQRGLVEARTRNARKGYIAGIRKESIQTYGRHRNRVIVTDTWLSESDGKKSIFLTSSENDSSKQSSFLDKSSEEENSKRSTRSTRNNSRNLSNDEKEYKLKAINKTASSQTQLLARTAGVKDGEKGNDEDSVVGGLSAVLESEEHSSESNEQAVDETSCTRYAPNEENNDDDKDIEIRVTRHTRNTRLLLNQIEDDGLTDSACNEEDNKHEIDEEVSEDDNEMEETKEGETDSEDLDTTKTEEEENDSKEVDVDEKNEGGQDEYAEEVDDDKTNDKDTYDSTQSRRYSFRKASLKNPFSKMLLPPKVQGSLIPFPANTKVMDLCGQTEPMSFIKALTRPVLEKCVKIGEGVYGEVFRSTSNNQSVVFKMIPIEGDFLVNDEPQKKFDEIFGEIVIAKELSDLRFSKKHLTSTYCEVNSVSCVRGKYPNNLLKQWDEYDRTKRSENDRPDVFKANQLFIVFEIADCGTPLDNYKFNTLLKAKSVLTQITFALAAAEEAFQFEHRDLHWGNVLVRETKQEEIVFLLNGHKYPVSTMGVEASIIDYTMSRLTKDGCKVYCDLSKDDALFQGKGDYQFDIYRNMKEANGNDWAKFCPYTNVLWLHYLADKLVYKNASSLQSRDERVILRQFRQFMSKMLDYSSASEMAIDALLFNS